MTVSTSASQTVLGGNGSLTVFTFSFIAALASNLQVTTTDANGNQTVLLPSQYSVSLNAPVTGQLWGVGGSVTYPLSGSPIASGTSLTISRIVPLTQQTSISNQGSFYPQAVEQAIDTLCMEIQQVSARTGQLRGTWAIGLKYNFGDIVVDGANGANTGNYYMCLIANTSATWSSDLAAGDWSLAINIQAITSGVIVQLPSLLATPSTTAMMIATGSLSFTVPAGLSFAPGMFATAVANGAPSNYVHGTVTAYSGTTLTIDSLDTGGSGTYSSWAIALSGSAGTEGPVGPQGPVGGSLIWSSASANSIMAANNGYVTNSAKQLQMTFPATLAPGQVFEIDASQSAGGFIALPNIGQTINWGQVQLVGNEGVQGVQGAVVRFVASSAISVDVETINVAALVTQGNADVDPFWNNVTALLPLNTSAVPGTESSGNGLTVTNSSVTTTNTQTKYGSYSAAFGGSAYLNIASPGAAFNFPGNFTMEAWVFPTAVGASGGSIIVGGGTTGGAQLVQIAAAYSFALVKEGTGAVVTSGTAMTASAWNHIAVSKVGGTSYLFLNGITVGNAADANSYSAASAQIGGNAGTYFTGYLTQIRITKGVGRYSAAFMVPAQAFLVAEDLSADPVWNMVGMQLPFENNSTDQSGNAVSLTNTGSIGYSAVIAKVGSYSLGPLTSGSQSLANSAPGVFEFGTGDFTIEAWIYPVSTPTAGYIIVGGDSNGAPALAGTGNAYTFYLGVFGGSIIVTSTSAMTQNAWNHIAAVRQGGVVTLYLNGVAAGTASNTTSYAAAGVIIGCGGDTHYLDNTRISYFSRYTANFTPPAIPFDTALPTTYDPWFQNVTFMPRATSGNTGTDVSGNALVMSIGSVTTTSASKQDVYAFSFSGSNYVNVASPGQAIDFGTGDFTAEMWLAPTANAASSTPALALGGGAVNGALSIGIVANSTTPFFSAYGSSSVVDAGTLALNQWNHVAVARKAGTSTLYVNGANVGSASDTNSYASTQITIGGTGSAGYYFTGTIAGLRITKAARYTAPFSPPTTPFLTVGAT